MESDEMQSECVMQRAPISTFSCRILNPEFS